MSDSRGPYDTLMIAVGWFIRLFCLDTFLSLQIFPNLEFWCPEKGDLLKDCVRCVRFKGSTLPLDECSRMLPIIVLSEHISVTKEIAKLGILTLKEMYIFKTECVRFKESL